MRRIFLVDFAYEERKEEQKTTGEKPPAAGEKASLTGPFVCVEK